MQVPHRFFRAPLGWATLTVAFALSGCDMLGIETGSQEAARKLAEGKAIGSACRHAVRSIEDCYRNNPKAGKAAVFEGWREMDEYMRENKIEGMPSEKLQPSGGMITEVDKHATDKDAAHATPPTAADTKEKAGKVELPPRPTVVKP